MFRFSPHALSPLIGFTVLFALSLLVLYRSKRQGAHLAFALMNLATAAWNLDIFLLYSVRDAKVAHLVDRLFQPIIAVIPLLWLNFVTAFLGSRHRRPMMRVCIAWTCLLVVLSSTRLFIRDTVLLSFGFYGAAGPFYFLYVVTHLTVFLVIATLLAAHYLRAKETVARRQIGAFLLATVIMGILSADNFFPLYGVDRYPLGNIAVILYLIVVWLAVIRYRFMDIRTMIRKSLIYSIATFLLTAMYLVLILLLELLVRVYLLPDSIFIPLVPALVAAFMFQGVKEKVQERLDSLFGHEKKRTDLLSSFSRVARTVNGRGDLARLFCQKISVAFRPQRQAFFIREAESGRWRLEDDSSLGPEEAAFLAGEFLPVLVCQGKEIVDVAHPPGGGASDDPALYQKVAGMGFHLAVPLKGRDFVAGACLLGPKSGGGSFTGEDRSFIAALSGHVAAALEVREYYERRKREEKFTSLGRASAIISHELRNPLNVIKGAVAYLRTRSRGEEVSRFSTIIMQEVDRTASFIEQFLKASRVPPACKRSTEICGWARGFTGGWSGRHPSVSVDVAVPAEPTWAEIDPLLMEQLLENLFKNAAEAMGMTGRIRLRVAKDGDGREGEALTFTVADDGPGIPSDRRETLFDPFFTTKTGGSGLGLCVVDGVVRAHQGHIEVDSSPSGGASFRISLPLGLSSAKPQGVSAAGREGGSAEDETLTGRVTHG